jgi:hypothetical protein
VLCVLLQGWQAAAVYGNLRMAGALCFEGWIVCGDVAVAHQPNKH